MSKARTRLVNFRVTDEELEYLKTASGQQGARCLSDFARAVMLRQATAYTASGTYDDRLISFDTRLNALEHFVARLVEALSVPQLQRTKSAN